MISELHKNFVKTQLEFILGYGISLGKSEVSYHCPFCSHHKHKLQINLDTQKWRCWVCNSKGRKMYYLLKRLDAPIELLQQVSDIYPKDDEYITDETQDEIQLFLPREYKPILENIRKLEYKAAFSYLKNRGISERDIKKYKIGYCDGGIYKGRVIIPSYSAEGKLNYFIARSIYDNVSMGYKNPPVSKNVIAFESTINWNMPVNICEGAFDAISIKRNSIPTFGKYIPEVLMNKILEIKPDINLIPDSDAIDQATKYQIYFTNNGINCSVVSIVGKDPSEIGFTHITEQIKHNLTSSFEDIIKLKLNI